MGRLGIRLALSAPLLVLLAILVGVPAVAFGRDDGHSFRAVFRGIDETPSNSTDASASLHVSIEGSGDTAKIHYTLTYTGLRADVTQAHIHFAETKVAGGIMVWLCGTTALPGPTGTPTCPQPGGTVSGTIAAAGVVGPTPQGIAAGQMGRVVQAIRDGAAYGNVHSTMFPAGEIRGQLRADSD